MGLTVIDAGVMIAAFSASDPHHASASVALRTAVDRADQLVLPASALTECLVEPSSRGSRPVAIALDLLRRLPVVISPLDTEVAVRAAGLRARHRGRLKLGDALVVATAVELNADALLTTDRKWPKLQFTGELIVL